MSKLSQLIEERNTKNAALHAIFEESGPDRDMAKVTSLQGDTAAKVAEIQRRMTEVNAIGVQIDEQKALEDAAAKSADLYRHDNEPADRPNFGGGTQAQQQKGERKTPGQAFVESKSYKSWRPGSIGQVAEAEVKAPNFKATFTTAASTFTEYDRQAGIVLVGTQRLMVADLIPQAQTNANTIRYPQEDTYTNAATTVAEGATKPEASFDTSEVDAPVRKIAVTAKVTDEFFADFPAMQGYVDGRLRFMVAQQEETQLLTGDGIAPNLLGILNVSGIQTQAKAADPTFDAFYKAMVKILSVGFFDPTAHVIHPLDWQDIQLTRTADGLYILGNPADQVNPRLWGLPVVVTTAMTQNTGLVGAWNLGAQIFYREGIRVESTNSNEDDFKKNLIALRAEQREALAVYRPKAFCTVTGI